MCNCAPAHALAIIICVFCHPKGNYLRQIGRCLKESSSAIERWSLAISRKCTLVDDRAIK